MTSRSRLFQAAVLAWALVLPAIAAAQAGTGEAQDVARAVLAHADWTADARLCPTKVMGSKETSDHLLANPCKPGKLQNCLASCSEGAPGACYWLGQALQRQGASSQAYEPLFQRSCKLGVMSGCTNRAAGMLYEAEGDEAVKSCAAATFEAVCAFDDPWACTMSAWHLSRGVGTKQDTKRALEALEKSCKYGPEDEACKYGKRLRSDIEARARAR